MEWDGLKDIYHLYNSPISFLGGKENPIKVAKIDLAQRRILFRMDEPVIKNIIWDVDGTLFDTYPAIARAFRAALADLGKDSDLDRILGLSRQSLGLCTTTLAAENRLNEDELDRAFGDQYDRIKPGDQPPFPGAKEICQYITSIGGKNVILTHRGRKGTDELLAAHDMARFFSGSITREDGHPRKPDPAAFEAALETCALQKKETLTVGDREIDVLAGRAAGIRTCLFRGEDSETIADFTIHDFSELRQYILSMNMDGG